MLQRQLKLDCYQGTYHSAIAKKKYSFWQLKDPTSRVMSHDSRLQHHESGLDEHLKVLLAVIEPLV